MTAAFLLLLALPIDARAYIDPGSGSYLLQIAIAGIVGGLYAAKSYWRGLIAKIRSRFDKR